MRLLLKMFKEIKENLKYVKEDAIYEEHEYVKNEPNQTRSENLKLYSFK